MKTSDLERKLADALRDVLPYAESRVEDLVESVDSCVDDATRSEAKRRADLAVDRFNAARELLMSMGLPRRKRKNEL